MEHMVWYVSALGYCRPRIIKVCFCHTLIKIPGFTLQCRQMTRGKSKFRFPDAEPIIWKINIAVLLLFPVYLHLWLMRNMEMDLHACFRNSFDGLIYWAIPMNSGECQGTQIMSQHWLTHRGRVTHICVSKTYHHMFRQWFVAWMAPKHYLTQCWNIVYSNLRNRPQGNLNQNSYIFI